MIEKDYISRLMEKEFATTLRVIRAYPADKLTFAPHERSSTARNLIRTFVFEMYLIKSYALGANLDRSFFQSYAPEEIRTLMLDFGKESAEVLSAVRKMGEEELNSQVEFAGKKMSAADFIMLMVLDQIHHRGQLTVYVRLAGGKVPSVYGPSADDPSVNL